MFYSLFCFIFIHFFFNPLIPWQINQEDRQLKYRKVCFKIKKTEWKPPPQKKPQNHKQNHTNMKAPKRL